jgi:hypothetical protein
VRARQRNVSSIIRIGVLLFVATTASRAFAYDEDDPPGTQATVNGVTAHVCPVNAANSVQEAMVGVDAANNRFLCSNAVEVLSASNWTADTSTQVDFPVSSTAPLGAKVSIHVCPQNEVMVGWNEAKDVLFCAPVAPGAGYSVQLSVDYGGTNETKIQEKNFPRSVHGCSSTGEKPVMAGIKADENILVCINFTYYGTQRAAGAPPPATDAAKREAWRQLMGRTPFPKPGCYASSYPNTQWQEVPCSTAPARPHPTNGDYSAQVSSGSISSATGSFSSVTGATGETDTLAGANHFSLQLNMNTFNSSLCTNRSANCAGQQFIYDSPGDVYIQYWVFQPQPCPTQTVAGHSWGFYNGSTGGRAGCYINGNQITVTPSQPITNLGALQFSGSLPNRAELSINHAPYPTNGCGQAGDTVLCTANDGVDFLSVGSQWTEAEFNVFGWGGGSTANLTPQPGTTIVVTTSVDNGTTNPPVVGGGITKESNNLTLIPPPCPIGGASPAIVFTESNSAGVTSTCACHAGYTWDPNTAACVCTPKTVAQACGALQCAGSVPDGCGGTVACPANCPSGQVCNPLYGSSCCTPPVQGQSLPNQCAPICPKCAAGYVCAAGVGEAYGHCVVNTRCEPGSHYCVDPKTGNGECLPQIQPCPQRSN